MRKRLKRETSICSCKSPRLQNKSLLALSIVWMRIGAFFFDSKVVHLSERLSLPLKIINKDEVEKAVESCGACVPSNIREGIWIAGTTQILEARHIKLSLCEGFRNGSQNYEMIGSYTINKFVGATPGGIFDLIHIKDHVKAGKLQS